MARDPDDHDEREPTDESGGIFGIRIGAGLSALADILEELDDEDETSGSGRSSDGRRTVDYRYSVETGLGDITSSDASPSRRGRPRSEGDGPRRADDAGPRSGAPSTRSEEYLTTTRRENGDLVVVADLANVTEDDLSLGIDQRSNELVIGVGGTVVERIPLEWDDVEVDDATFNNQVLEVRLGPGEEHERDDG